MGIARYCITAFYTQRTRYSMKKYCVYIILITLTYISCTNKKAGNGLANQAQSTDQERSLEQATRLLKEYKTDSAEVLLQGITNEETKLQVPKIYIKAELNLGKINSDRGNNVMALAHYQKAIQTAESIGDQAIMPHILKNIGILYVQWKKFDEAFNYYDKAEKLALETGNEELLADCQNNKGTIYEQREQYDQALAAYESALSHYIAAKIQGKIAMAYSNMAIVYKLQKKYNESVNYNLKAIDILEKIQDKWSMAATYNNIGNLYGEIGNYKQAIDYCNKSLSIAKEIEAEEIIGMAYESMANAAASAGDYKNAFNYHKNHSESMNKFINKESTQQLSELNVRYETEKKEKQIAESQLASKQKNIWLILLGGVLLTGLLVFINFRIKSKHKQQQLVLENELLKEQTHSKMQEQRLEISRDLHDSVGAQLTLINSILDGLKSASSKLDATVNSKINTLSDFSENSIAELKNALWVLNSKEIYLDDLKSKILNFIRHASEAKDDVQFNFNFDVSENFNLNSRQAVNLFRAVQEIVNNALKYADASEIKIDAVQHEKNLTLKITDNGKGFDYNKEKNKSYGLRNIESRIAEVNGKVNLETESGKGTEYKIEMQLF